MAFFHSIGILLYLIYRFIIWVNILLDERKVMFENLLGMLLRHMAFKSEMAIKSPSTSSGVIGSKVTRAYSVLERNLNLSYKLHMSNFTCYIWSFEGEKFVQYLYP